MMFYFSGVNSVVPQRQGSKWAQLADAAIQSVALLKLREEKYNRMREENLNNVDKFNAELVKLRDKYRDKLDAEEQYQEIYLLHQAIQEAEEKWRKRFIGLSFAVGAFASLWIAVETIG
jgi:hypothetical protein